MTLMMDLTFKYIVTPIVDLKLGKFISLDNL